eukprot:4373005-Heterocapsa_arctica.AAC.1
MVTHRGDGRAGKIRASGNKPENPQQSGGRGQKEKCRRRKGGRPRGDALVQRRSRQSAQTGLARAVREEGNHVGSPGLEQK